MKYSTTKLALLLALLLGTLPTQAQTVPPTDASIPFSSIASPEAQRAFQESRPVVLPPQIKEKIGQFARMTPKDQHSFFVEYRAWEEEQAAPTLAAQNAAYKVHIAPATIGGIDTEVFTPVSGILPGNADRVLINLRGGAFTNGTRAGGRIESIPIAAVARIKVISIAYRQAPEFQFPAATDDVLSVYRELLKTYKPGNIGIYGCSAGGTLTAQVTATMLDKNMPRPGAIGMFCGTGEVWSKGDSAYFWALLNGHAPAKEEHDPKYYPYLRGVDLNNPLIFPMRYPQKLGGFPPSLLITGTRSFEMSTIIDANNKLTAAGVETELHIWDGMTHGFFMNPALPESQQAYGIIARFFKEKLGPWYRPELQKFLTEDLASPPARCSILFIGSSSIKLWTDLEQNMAPVQILNRGFGGSTIADINDVFDRAVTPYWPKAIFFYAGENDLSALHHSPAEVAATFERFLVLKTSRLGNIPVYFLSINPSKLRWADLTQQQETNRLIEQLAVNRSDLHYIDVATSMIDQGKVRDIFGADQLHLTREGYRIWTEILLPLVMREAKRPARSCEVKNTENPVPPATAQ